MRTRVEQRGYEQPGRSRRAVLRTAAGAALGVTGLLVGSGCGLLGNDSPPAPADPLDPLLVATLALAGRYDAAIAGHPELADRLTPIRDAHRAHAAALGRLLGRASASPDPASPTAPAGAVPSARDAAGVLAELRAAERTGQDEATAACLAAPAGRATLLGAITAARASHQEVLRS